MCISFMTMCSPVRIVSVLCLLIGIAVSTWFPPPVTPSPAPFEAAFQGSCTEKNPCAQLCFDLHDGTFECGCREGLVLSKDGYSCGAESALGAIEDQAESDAPLATTGSASWEDNISDDNMDEMAFDDDISIKTEVVDGRRRTLPQSMSRTREHHPNDVMSGHRVHRPPVTAKKTKKPQVPLTSTASLAEQTSGQCDDLTCPTGLCVTDAARGNRCLCTLGRRGTACQQDLEVRLPRFSGHSYLTFPPLRNAFRNSQVVLEFRPEALQGLLVYSGDEAGADGDFMALVLVDGFVEFRFDCGSGMATVRSAEPVVIYSWNRVVVYRHRWDAWLQLNGGLHSQGRAKGLLSRITFRQHLFVGGAPTHAQVAQRLKVDVGGLVGCLRHLEVNDHAYDFRPAPRGEALAGLDIIECTANLCTEVVCENGGTCSSEAADAPLCLCPLGYSGARCETAVDLVMPAFNGSSYLKYPGLGSSVLSFIELTLVFKPTSPDGIFFYNGFRTDGTGDFLSLGMSRGHVEFRFDLGTGPAIIRSREPVALLEWHTVFISRTGRDGVLSVDRQPSVEGMADGAFTQLSLPQNLYLGGVPNFDEVSRKLGQRSNFQGCIQQMTVNSRPVRILDAALGGINVDNCVHPCVTKPCLNGGTCTPRLDRFSCHCQLGYTETRCQTEVLDSIATPMFVGNSFLKFTQEEVMKRVVGNKMMVELKLKTIGADGLVMWTGEREMTPTSDFLAIGLHNGRAHLRFNLGGGEVFVEANGTRLDDGHWHRIRVVRTDQEGTLLVDDDHVVMAVSPGPLRQLNTNNGLYLGGMEDVRHLSHSKYSSGLVGCIAEVRLATDFRVEFLSQASSGMNIEVCV